MLSSEGFDLWANGYDQSVGISDEDRTYPFAGYKHILNEIYRRILSSSAARVLDIGFGTGTLSAKLYAHGFEIYGQDFSARMIELAQPKMPNAKLYQGDFSQGLAAPLTQQTYDAILSTYALHHLTDAQKVVFLRQLLPLLNENGAIYIGDVAFKTRAQLEACKKNTGDEWDEEEIYFVADELAAFFPHMTFEQVSPCAGLIIIRK